MRVVFVGTPDLAVPCLAALLGSRHEVPLVVTQPDRRAGRGRKVLPPPIKELALSHHLPLIQPESINRPEAVARLREIAPDVIVVIAYGKRLLPRVLELPRHGCLNVHVSLLPKYRGAAPVAYAILKGESETGVTVQRMAPGIDTGPILTQRATAIGPEETSGELASRLAVLAADLLLPNLDQVEACTLTEMPQDPAMAGDAPKLAKSDGLIPWDRDARQVFDFVRAMTPWPGAFTFHHSGAARSRGRLIVLATRPVPSAASGQVPDSVARPGVVVQADEHLVAAAGTGFLEILRVKPEGGKPMEGAAYLRGHSVRVGDRFRAQA